MLACDRSLRAVRKKEEMQIKTMTDRKPLHLQSRFGIQVVVGSQRNLSFSNGTSVHRIIEYSLRKFVSMEIKEREAPESFGLVCLDGNTPQKAIIIHSKDQLESRVEPTSTPPPNCIQPTPFHSCCSYRRPEKCASQLPT